MEQLLLQIDFCVAFSAHCIQSGMFRSVTDWMNQSLLNVRTKLSGEVSLLFYWQPISIPIKTTVFFIFRLKRWPDYKKPVSQLFARTYVRPSVCSSVRPFVSHLYIVQSTVTVRGTNKQYRGIYINNSRSYSLHSLISVGEALLKKQKNKSRNPHFIHAG